MMSKELESLEEIRKYLYGDVYAGAESKLDLIENALKALEIIKEINKNALLQFISVCVKDQDKCDLLKEVLL